MSTSISSLIPWLLCSLTCPLLTKKACPTICPVTGGDGAGLLRGRRKNALNPALSRMITSTITPTIFQRSNPFFYATAEDTSFAGSDGDETSTGVFLFPCTPEASSTICAPGVTGIARRPCWEEDGCAEGAITGRDGDEERSVGSKAASSGARPEDPCCARSLLAGLTAKCVRLRSDALDMVSASVSASVSTAALGKRIVGSFDRQRKMTADKSGGRAGLMRAGAMGSAFSCCRSSICVFS